MFTIKNKQVTPEVDALLIPVFNKIWDRDKSERKEKAILELSYIEFMVNPRPNNPYVEYTDAERHDKLAKDLFGGKFKVDSDIAAAIDWYIEHLETSSIALRLYKANLNAVHSLIGYLEAINFEERTKGGVMVHKPERIPNLVDDAQKALKGLQELRKRIMDDDFVETKSKGGKKISEFEKV